MTDSRTEHRGLERRGLGWVPLGVAAFLVGLFGLSVRGEIGSQMWTSIVELVAYLLLVAGAVTVLVGLVRAGLALVRR